MNLTVTKSTNQREVEMMFGKAMCAYANWQNNESSVGICNDKELAQFHANRALIDQSEYEATVRCISMFVNESLPKVCMAVINAAESEFNL